ncbi:hypothetical protein GCM10011505_48790 [Tistrella bauzanensis]|uniref:Uncharacterized protein n=1 Tax=Tistrella bauzanensis TaxID=657419 RepID=A0ABQ1JAU0_9PROT|nr:hypothetical protein GCM10011505_48790 [Tistrella bauzanensis]
MADHVAPQAGAALAGAAAAHHQHAGDQCHQWRHQMLAAGTDKAVETAHQAIVGKVGKRHSGGVPGGAISCAGQMAALSVFNSRFRMRSLSE